MLMGVLQPRSNAGRTIKGRCDNYHRQKIQVMGVSIPSLKGSAPGPCGV